MSGLDCYNGVFIGRGHSCKVRIKDESLSKTHAMLKFNPASGWILQDGDLQGNASTNGTWLYANEEFEIYEEMLFKTSKAVFKAKLSN